MIDDYQEFHIPDQSAQRNHLVFEVNWKPKDKETNECKVLRIKYPDGRKAFIKKEHLYSMLFALGSRKEQMKMVPQKIKEVRHYDTTLYLQLKQDAKKGDIIKTPVHISLPSVEDEIIGEVLKDEVVKKKVETQTKGGIIIPKAISNPAKTDLRKLKKVEKVSKQ